MAFVDRGWRLFLRTGDPDPTAWRDRVAGQLMTSASCTDPRAWSLSAEERRRYLVDLMRRGPGDIGSIAMAPRETMTAREPPPPPPPPPPRREEMPVRKQPDVVKPEQPGEPKDHIQFVDSSASSGKKIERSGDFCQDLCEIANELEQMLKEPSVRTYVPRIFEICSVLSDLSKDCDKMNKRLSEKESRALVLEEAVRATTDTELQEELNEKYETFDTSRFQYDIAQVRALEDKLNHMRVDGIEDDADETDEAWELRNFVARLQNQLEFPVEYPRLTPSQLEDYSQTDDMSVSQELDTIPEPEEAEESEEVEEEEEEEHPEEHPKEHPEEKAYVHEDQEFYTAFEGRKDYEDMPETEYLRTQIQNLQRRIEVLENEKERMVEDSYVARSDVDPRELQSLREELQMVIAERDSLFGQLSTAKTDLEAVQQEKESLLNEAEQIRQQFGEIQVEHLAALDHIKSLEDAATECQMMREECKSREVELNYYRQQYCTQLRTVHQLQCVIRDGEDERKRTLVHVERLSRLAECAKVLQNVHRPQITI